MYNYITVNGDSIITGISQLSGVVEQDNMFLVDDYDKGLIGKRRLVDGSFEVVAVEPVSKVVAEKDRLDVLGEMISDLWLKSQGV